MTNLKSVNVGMNKFCGPAVLSILTGKSTDECASVISRINGQYSVSGVQLNDLLKAADKLGFDSIPATKGNTLYGTLVRLANEDGMYIITVPNHFVTIEVANKRAYFCDNHTKEPIPAASSARLSQQVLAANKVIKRFEEPEQPKPKPIPVRYIEMRIYIKDGYDLLNDIAEAIKDNIYDYDEEISPVKDVTWEIKIGE